MSIIQLAAPQHIRGRVMSLLIVMSGLMPLAVAPIGAIAEYFGVAVALAFAAVMVGFSAFVLNFFFPQVKKITHFD